MAILSINVTNYDASLGDPANPFADDYNAGDAGWSDPSELNGMPFYLKHYSFDESQFIGATGTGLFNPFLNMNGDSTLLGFNTDIDYSGQDFINAGYPGKTIDISNPNTDALRLGDIPIIYRDFDGDGTAEAYYQINLDINENTGTEVSLEQLQIYTSSAYATLPDFHFDTSNPLSLAFANNPGDAATDFTLRFNMQDYRGANDTAELLMRDDGAGQGKLDYAFYFPVAMFAGAKPTDYVTLFSQFGPTPPDDAGFAEWNTINAAKITGIKFNDSDNDGVRDNGEGPLQGFVIYIDQDGDNKLDSFEQYTVTASDGSFAFYSLLPNTNYTVREVLTSADRGSGWTDGAWAALLPPNAGTWVQTTDLLNDGDQTVVVGAPGTYSILVGNHQLVPNITIDKVFVNVTDADTIVNTPSTTVINGAGDIANFTIAVHNNGEVDLTNVVVTDALSDSGAVEVLKAGGFNFGDTDSDDILDMGETWHYTATRTATQGDLNTNGGGDGDLDNSATVTASPVGGSGTVTATDSAAAPIVPAASLAIVKLFDGWTGGDGDSLGDAVGDVGNYTIRVTNTGNVTLTSVVVTDPLTGNVYNVGTLQPGQSSAALPETYVLDQDDLDSDGTVEVGSFQSGSIENTATADSDQTGPASASAVAPIVYDPDFTVVKAVASITDGPDFNGSNQADSAGDKINYTITIDNTGNITLTGFTYTDLNADGDAIAYASGDTDLDGDLDVTETWVYTAVHTVTQAELDNPGTSITGGLDTDGDTDNRVTVDFVETFEKSSSVSTPLVYAPSLNIVKDVTSITGGVGTNGLTGANDAGDKINYAISVQNTGNVTLTGVVVTDPNADAGTIVRVADLVGDNDALLEVGETWAYTAVHTVTQAELDNNGGGDGDIDNIATADSNETGPDTDDASAPVLPAPSLNIVKDVTSITGGVGTNGLTGANDAGDKINYAISVQNTGNVTLTGVVVTDPNADAGTIVRVADLVGDNDALLEVGETWAYTAVHTVTQAELDNNGGGDGDIDNVATADSNETGPDTDPADAPLLYNPLVNVEKYVNTDVTDNTVNGGWEDADLPSGPEASLSSTVDFKVVVTNTGNVTLTGIKIADVLDGGALNYTTLNAQVDIDNDGDIDGTWASYDTNNDGVLDTVGLGPNASMAVYYSYTGQLGEHQNIATVTTTQGATDNDAANYFMLDNCVGVRTPGFWNRWTNLWDGTAVGDPKQMGTVGFPEEDVLYKVDSNGDGAINGQDQKGLLIGDFNGDGLGTGEDVIFISLPDAQSLVGASNKTVGNDGVQILGRDVIASWLNYLAGNGINNPGTADDSKNPQHFIQDAVNYLQAFAGTQDGKPPSDTNPLFQGANDTFDIFVLEGHKVTKTSTSFWQSPQPDQGYDHSGSAIHSALDQYNNDGMIGTIRYSCDADDAAFQYAAAQVVNIL
ncbi:putative repeat protein (TIGR01451 family) [Novosphingobium kunmingense]|uniref:Putative repeat protein (TIGR01451 family) n=1 Tax=Novosphingobium kunmingense TaxID=1211806 RepID=A0A2N0I3H4_9SPHN|nr:DUF11 domain-containing protein [Novosphingobium kunmingense]PKB25715.1 putative repeat protein (TIGR01451 family) [Novosphingobium kunmingense]